MTFVTSICKDGPFFLELANLFQKDNMDEAKRYVYQAFQVVWLLATPIMLGLMGVSSVFIPLFLGSGFDDAIGLLCIFSVLVLVVSLAYVAGISYLIPTKQQNVYTVAVTVAAMTKFLYKSFINTERSADLEQQLHQFQQKLWELLFRLYTAFGRRQIKAKQICATCW